MSKKDIIEPSTSLPPGIPPGADPGPVSMDPALFEKSKRGLVLHLVEEDEELIRRIATVSDHTIKEILEAVEYGVGPIVTKVCADLWKEFTERDRKDVDRLLNDRKAAAAKPKKE